MLNMWVAPGLAKNLFSGPVLAMLPFIDSTLGIYNRGAALWRQGNPHPCLLRLDVVVRNGLFHTRVART